MKPGKKPIVKEIESPSGLDLNPEPPSAVRLSKRAVFWLLWLSLPWSRLWGTGSPPEESARFRWNFIRVIPRG
jgi:hypothetical protein